MAASAVKDRLDSKISREILDKYLEEDLALINCTTWTQYKKNDDEDVCDRIIVANDPIWRIKVTGSIEGSLANISNLLDAAIKERQSEWHELYAGGEYIYQDPANSLEVCLFRYLSPVSFVSPRDTVYLKVRRDYYNENNELQSFLLSYRSLDLDEILPVSKGHVRTLFQGAHYIQVINQNCFRYTYYQRADPCGLIIKRLSNGPQCSIMLKEVQGVRRAVKNPMIHTNRFHKSNTNDERKAAEEVSSK
jgi:hypothetical protein